jgi:hypothetical protein
MLWKIVIPVILLIILLIVGLFNATKTWGILCIVFATIGLTVLLIVLFLYFYGSNVLYNIVENNFPVVTGGLAKANSIVNTTSSSLSNFRQQALTLKNRLTTNFTFKDFYGLLQIIILYGLFLSSGTFGAM